MLLIPALTITPMRTKRVIALPTFSSTFDQGNTGGDSMIFLTTAVLQRTTIRADRATNRATRPKAEFTVTFSSNQMERRCILRDDAGRDSTHIRALVALSVDLAQTGRIEERFDEV